MCPDAAYTQGYRSDGPTGGLAQLYLVFGEPEFGQNRLEEVENADNLIGKLRRQAKDVCVVLEVWRGQA
eukprot:scaffold226857_cov27-Tisochrysis_lutea.AAC.3